VRYENSHKSNNNQSVLFLLYEKHTNCYDEINTTKIAVVKLICGIRVYEMRYKNKQWRVK